MSRLRVAYLVDHFVGSRSQRLSFPSSGLLPSSTGGIQTASVFIVLKVKALLTKPTLSSGLGFSGFNLRFLVEELNLFVTDLRPSRPQGVGLLVLHFGLPACGFWASSPALSERYSSVSKCSTMRTSSVGVLVVSAPWEGPAPLSRFTKPFRNRRLVLCVAVSATTQSTLSLRDS